MDDKFVKDFELSFDDQLLKDYANKIRTEIFNKIEDLKKENDDFHKMLISEENILFYKLKNNIKDERLTKLIDIYSIIYDLLTQNYYTKKSVKRIKFLVGLD